MKSMIKSVHDTIDHKKLVELEEKDFSSGYVKISLEYKKTELINPYEWKIYEIIIFVDGLRCLTFHVGQYSYLNNYGDQIRGYCLNGDYDIYRHGILYQRIHYSSAQPHGDCFEYDVHGKEDRYACYVQGKQINSSKSHNGRFIHKEFTENGTVVTFSDSYKIPSSVDHRITLQDGKACVWEQSVNGQFIEKARVVDVQLEFSSRSKSVLVERDKTGKVQYVGEYKINEGDYSYVYEGRGMKFKSTGEMYMGNFQNGKRNGNGVIYKGGLKFCEVECVDGKEVNSRRFVDGLPVLNEIKTDEELDHFSSSNVDMLVAENGLKDIPYLNFSADKYKMIRRMIFGRNSLSRLSQFSLDNHANVEQIEFNEDCLRQCEVFIIKGMYLILQLHDNHNH